MKLMRFFCSSILVLVTALTVNSCVASSSDNNEPENIDQVQQADGNLGQPCLYPPPYIGVCNSGLICCGPPGSQYCYSKQDRHHCGTCNDDCDVGNNNANAECNTSHVCYCDNGLTFCYHDFFSSCSNLQTDNANCGSCGNVCTGGTVCGNGVCGTACLTQPGTGTKYCDGGYYCNGSVCVQASCTTDSNCVGKGGTCCAGHCVNVNTDPTYCGACIYNCHNISDNYCCGSMCSSSGC